MLKFRNDACNEQSLLLHTHNIHVMKTAIVQYLSVIILIPSYVTYLNTLYSNDYYYLFTHTVDFALEVKNRTNLTTIHSLSLYFIILVGIIALVLHNIV